MKMKILSKTITNIDQIKSRIGIADGLEVALMGRAPTPEITSILRDNFNIVNLETNDAFYKTPTYMLIDPFSKDEYLKNKSRSLIEDSFNVFLSLNNKGYFTVHNVSHCRQEKRNYKLPSILEIQDRRDSFHEYIRSLDDGKGLISLENVFPNTVNNCSYDYGDFGKLFEDFPKDLGITFDLGHYTITLAMYAEGIKKQTQDDFVSLRREIDFLSFMGSKEKELGKESAKGFVKEPSKGSLSDLVREKIGSLGERVKVIHCSNVMIIRDLYEDGFLDGVLDLNDIIRSSKAKHIVPEVVDKDYIKIDNQKKIINYLKSFL